MSFLCWTRQLLTLPLKSKWFIWRYFFLLIILTIMLLWKEDSLIKRYHLEWIDKRLKHLRLPFFNRFTKLWKLPQTFALTQTKELAWTLPAWSWRDEALLVYLTMHGFLETLITVPRKSMNTTYHFTFCQITTTNLSELYNIMRDQPRVVHKCEMQEKWSVIFAFLLKRL